jgi:hypothetical protein
MSAIRSSFMAATRRFVAETTSEYDSELIEVPATPIIAIENMSVIHNPLNHILYGIKVVTNSRTNLLILNPQPLLKIWQTGTFDFLN